MAAPLRPSEEPGFGRRNLTSVSNPTAAPPGSGTSVPGRGTSRLCLRAAKCFAGIELPLGAGWHHSLIGQRRAASNVPEQCGIKGELEPDGVPMRKQLTVAAGLLAGLAQTADAQQIVGRNDTSFSLNETVATGDWVRIA